ncbi:MAG TPA: DUF4149 domain-containing protein [Thermoanaerobaculia bacterium]|nr:DUF4149 domain-containing protein [Thermoanaerobaculia bacterium]
MTRLTDSVARLGAAFWLGSGAFLVAVAAPAAFRGASSATEAANIVGRMLIVWHYIALLVPMLLLVREWYGRALGRTVAVVLLSVALMMAAAQAATDLKIRRLRSDSLIAMSDLPRTDPVRREFGALHGMSSLLMLGEILCAAAFVASSPIFREETRDS